MDEGMQQFQQSLIELENEAEHLLLARNQVIENDKERNGNREALTALRKRAKTTKTSIKFPFESIMKDIGKSGSRTAPLVKEICGTCGNHDEKEKTWMMFPGSDVFACIPFHAAHTILDKDQERLEYEAKKLQSYVKEKTLLISEKASVKWYGGFQNCFLLSIVSCEATYCRIHLNIGLDLDGPAGNMQLYISSKFHSTSFLVIK
ncbi:hypothetical protein NC653_006463 [Populus alba x Populus x berolinensis]|uniref:P53 and DNA damage-regulated protein 1 n=1 Tax=Populus alba x Populus x berolinensis TaxID=444605 RepID=A0AAD6WED5_9ROSI|nr:hypothetical protein NC653_006463 [Populus alba x Populus x berolinensis]